MIKILKKRYTFLAVSIICISLSLISVAYYLLLPQNKDPNIEKIVRDLDKSLPDKNPDRYLTELKESKKLLNFIITENITRKKTKQLYEKLNKKTSELIEMYPKDEEVIITRLDYFEFRSIFLQEHNNKAKAKKIYLKGLRFMKEKALDKKSSRLKNIFESYQNKKKMFLDSNKS
ncbi:MAG: hypothetical protein ABEH43_09445 [Flavobacteriales bacterium]